MNNQYDVFISHLSSNAASGRHLKKLLENSDLSCWMTDNRILEGSSDISIVYDVLSRSRTAIVIFNDDSPMNSCFNHELAYELNKKVEDKRSFFVVPVYVPSRIESSELRSTRDLRDKSNNYYWTCSSSYIKERNILCDGAIISTSTPVVDMSFGLDDPMSLHALKMSLRGKFRVKQSSLFDVPLDAREKIRSRIKNINSEIYKNRKPHKVEAQSIDNKGISQEDNENKINIDSHVYWRLAKHKNELDTYILLQALRYFAVHQANTSAVSIDPLASMLNVGMQTIYRCIDTYLDDGYITASYAEADASKKNIMYKITQKGLDVVGRLTDSMHSKDSELLVDAIPSSSQRPDTEDRPSPNYERLTTRERQVLALIAAGYTRREIAEKLHISHNTASCHVAHIYEKLKVSTIAEATRVALELGIMDPQSMDRLSSAESVDMGAPAKAESQNTTSRSARSQLFVQKM